MIKRIEITNFMSHARTVIEPADGLTVIVGENNTGKSALISALQVLCRNASGDFMVRHGEKDCRICITTADGHEIEWRRKNKVVSYRIDGRDVHRLGGSVPEDLHSLLRLPLVETETDPFDIHFGEQKKPIFLLNESPARRATFFASSSDTIKLIEMQGRHRRKIQEARTIESDLVRREAALEHRRDKLAAVDALGDAIGRLEKDYEQIRETSGDLAVLEQKLRALEAVTEGVLQWAGAAAATKGLDPPPRLHEVAPLSRLIAQFRDNATAIESGTRRVAAAARLAPPPVLADTRPLRDLIRQIDRFAGRTRTCRALQATAAPLTPPPALADATGLKQLIENIGRFRQRQDLSAAKSETLEALAKPPAMADLPPLKRLIGSLTAALLEWTAADSAVNRLHALPVPPAIADVAALASRIERLAAAERDVGRRQAALEAIRAEQAAARTALVEHLEATGVCPTCGQDLDPDGFIDRMPMAGGESR